MYSSRVGSLVANISSLVANISAPLRVASRWAPASHLHDCPAWALVSFCCWRQSSDCVMGASSPTLDTLGSFRMCPGQGRACGWGWSGDLWSASSLGWFLGVRGDFEDLGKWMCVELHQLLEQIKALCYQLNHLLSYFLFLFFFNCFLRSVCLSLKNKDNLLVMRSSIAA